MQFFESIYVFRNRYNQAAFRGQMHIRRREEGNLMLRGQLLPTQPVLITHHMGGVLFDVIWTDMIHPFLVSNRVIDLLFSNNVTGWTVYSVELYDKHDRLTPGYHGFAMLGRCGPISTVHSSYVSKIYSSGYADRRGAYFDPPTWDGSDIFITSEPNARKYMTKRTVELLQKNRIRNVEFIPAHEYQWFTNL